MKVVFSKDLAGGVLLLLFGLAVMWIASEYRMGTARQMGPGYMPMVLGGITVVLSLIVAVRALLTPSEKAEFNGAELRALAAVSGGVLAFALLIKPAGLIVAIAALALICLQAQRGVSIIERVSIVAAIALLASGVFVWGLKVQVSLLPSF